MNLIIVVLVIAISAIVAFVLLTTQAARLEAERHARRAERAVGIAVQALRGESRHAMNDPSIQSVLEVALRDVEAALEETRDGS